MRRRRLPTWSEHLERDARRHLHIAHIAVRAGDPVCALEALAVACGSLMGLAALQAGAR